MSDVMSDTCISPPHNFGKLYLTKNMKSPQINFDTQPVEVENSWENTNKIISDFK